MDRNFGMNMIHNIIFKLKYNLTFLYFNKSRKLPNTTYNFNKSQCTKNGKVSYCLC